MNCIHGIDMGMWCSTCAKSGPFPCGTAFVHDGIIARGVDSSYVNPNATGTCAEEIEKLRHSIDDLCGSVDKMNELEDSRSPYLGSATDDDLIRELRARSCLFGSIEKIKSDCGIVKRGPVTRHDAASALAGCRFSLAIEDAQDFLTNFAKSRGLL